MVDTCGNCTGITDVLGKNLAAFNTFLFDNLPMYNKFRAPAMILNHSTADFSVNGCVGTSTGIVYRKE